MRFGQAMERLCLPLRGLSLIPIPMGRHEGSQQFQAHRHGLRKQPAFHLIDALALGKRLRQKIAHTAELLLGLAQVEFFAEIMV